MARPATGWEALDDAKKLLKTAKTADELRAAQAVFMPLELGLSLEATAKALGRSPGSVARLRSRYIKAGGGSDRTPTPRGGVRRRILTPQEEIQLAQEALLSYHKGAWFETFVQKLQAVAKARGQPISKSTAYRILDRSVKEHLHQTRLTSVYRLMTK